MLIAQTELVTVAAAGTPVQCTITEPCCAIFAYNPHAANAIYVGLAGLNKTTGANVIQAVAAAGVFNPILGNEGRNLIRPTDFWFDAAASSQTIEVTVWRNV